VSGGPELRRAATRCTPPPPTLAAGAAIALEDAVVLDELLAGTSGDGVEAAPPAFTERRWERCRLVVEQSVARTEGVIRPTPDFDVAAFERRIRGELASRSDPRGGMIAAMASAENVAAGARAVFFSIAYPDPKDGFATQDAASVFAQLEGLFHAARAIADPDWLGNAADAGDGAELPAPKPSQEPLVRRIHMDWRHIEVATELPWDFIVGGGLVGLVTMANRVTGETPRIQVAISQLAVEQADWEKQRTDAERAVLDKVTNTVVERSRLRPSYTRIYLGEEDEFEGWTA
jgi:hypothetical protein